MKRKRGRILEGLGIAFFLLLAGCGGGGGGSSSSAPSSEFPAQGTTSYSTTYSDIGVEGSGCVASSHVGTTTEAVMREGDTLSMFTGARVNNTNFFLTLNGAVASGGSFTLDGSTTSGGQSYGWSITGTFTATGWSGDLATTWEQGSSRCVWRQNFTGTVE